LLNIATLNLLYLTRYYILSKRLNFFIGHFLVSLIIIFSIAIIAFYVWYPDPLGKAVGVTHIFVIMLAVDALIGPFLSFLVYKEGKKTLKFDLVVIITIQISALCYGLFAIEQGRPAWLVFHADRFELVRKNNIILDSIDQAQPQFQYVSWTKPEFVAVKSATSTEQRQDDMFTEVLGGISLAQQPERYVELTQARSQLQKRALPIQELEKYNFQDRVEKTLAKYPEADAWLPLKTNAVDMVVLINKKTAEIIKIVNLRPWK